MHSFRLETGMPTVQGLDFLPCCIIWVWNLVCHFKGRA